MNIDLRHFKLNEFESPDEPGSGNMMDEDFLIKLDRARHIAKIPFYITSGYRTEKYNKEVGGVPSSSHTKGIACDIATVGSRTRYKVLSSLLEVGFNRIGINFRENFCHVDDDPEKDGNVIWGYGS